MYYTQQQGMLQSIPNITQQQGMLQCCVILEYFVSGSYWILSWINN